MQLILRPLFSFLKRCSIFFVRLRLSVCLLVLCEDVNDTENELALPVLAPEVPWQCLLLPARSPQLVALAHCASSWLLELLLGDDLALELADVMDADQHRIVHDAQLCEELSVPRELGLEDLRLQGPNVDVLVLLTEV